MSDYWDFVTPAEFLASVPDPDWIIEQVLSAGTELHLYGREGAGKSRLAWQLGYAIAEGHDLWLDAFRIRKQGRVLWLGIDMESNEMQAMLTDAEEAGILYSDNIVVNRDRKRFIYHQPVHHRLLKELNAEYDPTLVIVDNASQTGFRQLSNEEILEYLWVFRDAFPHAGKVHLNHTRRLTQEMKARGKSDNEGYLGGGEWSRGTRASLYLDGKYHLKTGKLQITKLRGILPYTSLEIERDNCGFWHLKERSPSVLLATWPHCLPSLNGKPVGSVRAVCRTIADAYPEHTAESLRAHYKREKESGVKYTWDDFTSSSSHSEPGSGSGRV